ncbi:glycosyltransferase family 2 protein [Nocardioides sp. cx-173]|uniref:glycosyltransferase family 2 protein n=1 Tax=Nocardioides sp. cx-173 TaxID=2898796 RepID=UPI001E42558D|nr:glycosyltransferase family 2 protein [Nocardioides sp. cx-173]MCD4526943.1 glycosyltransferase [Nocardioides sp. cx-173]UGB41269.1 glycosyltransferase [Nocardioides sp. cx-173]
MSVTAVICSLNRPMELTSSLTALAEQTRLPDRVVVVAQAHDGDTAAVAREAGAEVCITPGPGLALAIESAIMWAGSGVCAFVDDDARAHPDWIQRMEDAFADPTVGAVGGRDNVAGDGWTGRPDLPVGIITPTGRIIGNHHHGTGAVRQAQTVKGANMGIRVAAAIGFPLSQFVRGTGAQYRNELILTAEIRRRGYRVLYDPAIRVDHFPSQRALGDDRHLFSRERVALNVANEVSALRISEPLRVRIAYQLRAVAVGTRLHPGIVHTLRGAILEHRNDVPRFAGVIDGLRLGRQSRKKEALLISGSVQTVGRGHNA